MDLRFSGIRVFLMRQKRQINLILSITVIAALLIGLYTLSSKPSRSVESDLVPLDEASPGIVEVNEAVNEKAKPSQKKVESANRNVAEVDKKEDKHPVAKNDVVEEKPARPVVAATSPQPPRDSATKKMAMVRKIPEVIIIGVHNCRTKYLSDLLNQHSKISLVWGTNFYNVDTNYKKGKGWYLDHFPDIPKGNILIERSTKYYSSVAAAQRIKKMEPKTKIIFMACDPVKRTIGHYRAQKLDDETLEALENLVIHPTKKEVNEHHDFIVESIYHKHIQNWLEYFPKDQVFVLDDVSLYRQVNDELRKIEDFLHIGHEISKGEIYYNATRGTRCGRFDGDVVCFGTDRSLRPAHVDIPVDPTVVTKLKNYFKMHNEQFFQKVGQTFEW